MTTELQRIFNLAVRVYLPPLHDLDKVPVIGIAFANIDYPKQAEKILEATADKFRIDISRGDVLLNLKVSKAPGGVHLFDAVLNYEEREYELFKSQVESGRQGAFVLGAVHNGGFIVVTENVSSFRPFQVEAFIII